MSIEFVENFRSKIAFKQNIMNTMLNDQVNINIIIDQVKTDSSLDS